MSSVPERSDIDEEYKWDLDSIYASDDEWEAAYEEAEERSTTCRLRGTGHRGRCDSARDTGDLRGPDADRLERRRLRPNATGRGHDRRHVSGADRPLTGTLVGGQFGGLVPRPRTAGTGRDGVEAMVDEEPALEPYEHYFDDVLRTKDHTRSAEVEDLLAELGEVTGAPGEVYNMLANADMTFPTVEDPDGDQQPITLNHLTTLQKHPDRDFRQRVYEAFYDEWATVRNAVGTAYKNSRQDGCEDGQRPRLRHRPRGRTRRPERPCRGVRHALDTVRDNLATSTATPS